MPETAGGYTIVIARRANKFDARIEELGLVVTADTPNEAIAQLSTLEAEYLSAASEAGVAAPHRDPQASRGPVPGATSATTTSRLALPSQVAVVPARDSYLRFFIKSLIAAGVFVGGFGTVAIVGVYLVGNSLVNIAADAIQSRIAHLTELNLDVVSTGLVDSSGRVAAYIQRVPTERKIELQKNLRFIASELAPYLREIIEPLSAPPSDGTTSVPNNPANQSR